MDTTQLKCVIIDDEPAAIRILSGFADKAESLSVLQTFRNPLEAIAYLSKNQVDLIFLDINMPELNGLDLLKSLSKPPLVILTTAYSEYGAESYDFNVIDYLLKPIPFPRFLKAVHKANAIVNRKESVNLQLPEFFTIKDSGSIYKIQNRDLLYIEASGNYLKIFSSQQTIVIKSGLQDFLEKHEFLNLCRIHKSFAINISKVSKITYYKVKLEAKELPIGRKYRNSFLEQFEKMNT